MATLYLKKWENPFEKVEKKFCPVGCLSLVPKVAIAKFVWKMQKKVWYYEKWVGRHASFPPRRSVNAKSLTPQNVAFCKY